MRRFLVLAVLLAGGCCAVPREAADALADSWQDGIEADALAGMEARIDAFADVTPDRKASMKVTEGGRIRDFGKLIQEVKNAAR